MESLQDKATIWVPVRADEGAVLDSLISRADEVFGSCTTVEANKGTVVLLTVFADRRDRVLKFVEFVQSSARYIGTELDQDSVLVETNGIGGVYQKGKDY